MGIYFFLMRSGPHTCLCSNVFPPSSILPAVVVPSVLVPSIRSSSRTLDAAAPSD